jgi:hypothetical protein
LIDHFGIWLFELTKFQEVDVVTEEQRWVKLFQLGQTLFSECPSPVNGEEPLFKYLAEAVSAQMVCQRMSIRIT